MRHIFAVICSTGILLAQGSQFEVATIREAQPITAQTIQGGNFRVGMRTTGNQVDFGYMSLRDLISIAYEVKPLQIAGPDWITQQRYDIQALMPEGTDSKQVPVMLQALLKERFHLVARKESREQQVYGLEVAKGGHKMKESPAESSEPKEPPAGGQAISLNGQQIRVDRAGAAGAGGSATISGGQGGTTKMSMGPDGRMHLEVERMTMTQLADTLTPLLDLPVVDRTDLPGSYQVALDINVADLMQVASRAGVAVGAARAGAAVPGQAAPLSLGASDPSGGDLFAAVQKLGLRLEKQKGAIDTVVVESADKTPTEN